MKKILLMAVTAVLIISGCSTPPSAAATESEQTARLISHDSQTSRITADNTETTIEKPPICKERRTFLTEQAFVSAIKDDPMANNEHFYGLEGLSYYFVPETMPENTALSYIAVKDYYVAFEYKFDDKPDPHWERSFIFTWYRTKSSNNDSQPITYNITKVKPQDGYTGDNEHVCQEVDWTQDGHVFHAIVPIWFTQSDIETYCAAKQVTVK